MKLITYIRTHRLSRFTQTAVMSVAVDYFVFTALFVFSTPAIAAQSAARLSGGLFSFLINRNWTFSETKHGLHFTRQGLRFLALYVVSFFLSVSLITGFLFIWPNSEFVCKIVADFVCFLFNFHFMHQFVFSHCSKDS